MQGNCNRYLGVVGERLKEDLQKEGVEMIGQYKRSKLGQLIKDDLIARGKKSRTAGNWACWIDRFVSVCGEKKEYDRADVVKFVGSLRSSGMKQTSINTVLKAIRLLFQIQGWVMPKISMPKIRESDISRPVMSAVDLRALISKAKEVCREEELACLCLSTVYGLRREEITEVEIGEKVKVNTLKGGRVVEHEIPEGLRKYLRGYRRVGIRHMTRIFKSIVKKCQNGYVLGGGWHSIRRSLATELVMSEVSVLNIMRFMRWSEASMKGELGMLSVYAKKDQTRVDEAVFKVHPFLSEWIGEYRADKVNFGGSTRIRGLLSELGLEFEQAICGAGSKA